MEHVHISGNENGVRLESRILEERIQQAVTAGARRLTIEAFGQHGIGGRLWVSATEPVQVTVTGHAGQRLGSFGFPGTTIEVMGPASDDTGWLNAGAHIIVHGNAGNGTANAMAQGKLWVAGHIGARGMTMTKHNPRFAPPELWVLGGVGDYFAEFMAGGIAVVCGVDAPDPEQVLGYRPCVGMVGGRIFYRGPEQWVSPPDAKHVPLGDEDWQWLRAGLADFLERIGRSDLLPKLAGREDWHLVVARSPQEKLTKKRRSMSEFRAQVWDGELGRGGLIGDLTTLDRSPIGYIVTDELRRMVPVWENCKYLPPCQSSCPTGIPVRERWAFIRASRMDEAVNLALRFTPFPATVCGYLCPNLCMQGCTRNLDRMAPVDVRLLGRASERAGIPDLPPITGASVAIVGGGPAGISAAWQLRLLGHNPVVYDREAQLGGKLSAAIPESRIPRAVLEAELARARQVIGHVQLQTPLTPEEFQSIRQRHDFVILATGASMPRTLPVPGKERLITALDFLKAAKHGAAQVGRRVVIIGAGNVGCDVATEAARLGATDITLIDVQKPASFGKEREEAERAGARFLWPCFTKEITAEGVLLTDGRLLPADTVIVSIGDAPDLSAIPEDIARERGFVTVNQFGQTTDPRVFAIGDVVRLGLLTQAIGDGRRVAETIDGIHRGTRPLSDTAEIADAQALRHEVMDPGNLLSETIDTTRMHLAYFDPRRASFGSVEECASECASCGLCRDCGTCEAICPRGAISRQSLPDGGFAMVSDPKRCIGCGFCADSCPCGIWHMVPNTPMG